jgi:hypothetical protein
VRHRRRQGWGYLRLDSLQDDRLQGVACLRREDGDFRSPRNSTGALLIHAKNSEENRFLRLMPLENVFLLVPVLHHVVNGGA